MPGRMIGFGPFYRKSKAELRRWQGDSEYEAGGGDNTSRSRYSKQQKNKSTRYRKEIEENEEQNESRLDRLLGMIRNNRLHGLVRNSFKNATTRVHRTTARFTNGSKFEHRTSVTGWPHSKLFKSYDRAKTLKDCFRNADKLAYFIVAYFVITFENKILMIAVLTIIISHINKNNL